MQRRRDRIGESKGEAGQRLASKLMKSAFAKNAQVVFDNFRKKIESITDTDVSSKSMTSRSCLDRFASLFVVVSESR